MEVSPFIPYKLLLHREKVEASLRGELVYPISVELDLSNKCPHDCPFCSFGTSASEGYRQQNWDVFPYPRVLSLLEELATCGVKSLTFTGGGEPLIHPQAVEILRRSTALGFEWGVVTNGLLLGQDGITGAITDGATFVRVSLDAGSDATHMKTHGVRVPQYHKILNNIRRLRDFGYTGTIGASYCVMAENVEEISQAAQDMRAVGGNYLEIRPTFPTTWRGDGWEGGLSPEDMDLALAAVSLAKHQLNGPLFRIIGMDQRFQDVRDYQKPYSQCRVGMLTTVIGAEGSIWHCCVQRGQDFFKLGQVLTQSFQEAWAKVHATLDASKINVDRCPRCRYDGYNQILEQAFQVDGLHKNFV